MGTRTVSKSHPVITHSKTVQSRKQSHLEAYMTGCRGGNQPPLRNWGQGGKRWKGGLWGHAVRTEFRDVPVAMTDAHGTQPAQRGSTLHTHGTVLLMTTGVLIKRSLATLRRCLHAEDD
ncbi:hypothetical protein BaRGS_00021738 [Batillaria attramentaria]|uniref:Uncharacterized protein n=1 Tax=Batillaria attramentaria TaxID=370345 RepID=A0ABD0KJ96_9CAEN